MAKIIRIDTLHNGDRHKCSANGDGIRIVVWFCGCDIHCKGCHNQAFWDFNNPDFENFSDKHINLIKKEMEENIEIYSGLSVLGGEPFSIKNIDDVHNLCIKFIQYFPQKNIWIWSGHTLEWLMKQEGDYGKKIKDILNYVDYLVDGTFDINKRNIGLKFRGSSNQIIWKKDNNEWVKSELNN